MSNFKRLKIVDAKNRICLHLVALKISVVCIHIPFSKFYPHSSASLWSLVHMVSVEPTSRYSVDKWCQHNSASYSVLQLVLFKCPQL